MTVPSEVQLIERAIIEASDTVGGHSRCQMVSLPTSGIIVNDHGAVINAILVADGKRCEWLLRPVNANDSQDLVTTTSARKPGDYYL